MGLLPLEFSDCLLDSPYFRENLRAHEKQLDQTSLDIKTIIKDIQEVLDAAKILSKAKRNLSASLSGFQFDCLGTTLTDDEIIIANSLREFARFLNSVEDEMDRFVENAVEKFITPLVAFRKEQIGSVKKTKKDFDKQTAKFCAAQDRYVSISSKKEESLAEAAEAVRFERRNLNSSSLEYVYLMHVVQERKKFEFVEAILSFMQAWCTYYKHGQSVASDFSQYMNDLKSRVQKSRGNFSATLEQYDSLKHKMLTGQQDPGILNKMYTRQGYLYVQSKKNNLKIGSQWYKHYCQYQAKSKTLTMIPYSQLHGKITTTETLRVTSCVCKEDSNEKFRFVVTGEDPGEQGCLTSHTLQALSDMERKHWVEAMGGTWPAVNTLQKIKADSVEDNLNSLAFTFLKDCLCELEARGLTDQGLYRVGGVVSKVKRLLSQGLDPQEGDPPLDLSQPKQWESKTIASAVKQYFRDLNKPLMTHHLYTSFVEAAKHESEDIRAQQLQLVMHKLPIANREILKVLIRHLRRVADKAEKNLMTPSNLGVCFGPTLLRPREETVASIMDIKFCNEVVEMLIENSDNFFPPSSVGGPDSSPEVINRKSIEDPHSVRGSSTPKRTQSFSSFSQLSTNSLPDIKEFRTPASDRPRSKSHQAEFSLTPSRDTPDACMTPLAKSSTQDDLMASLEMMNSLAADLPNSSPLKRSNTMIPKKPRGNVKEVAKKPPLPKLSWTSPMSSPDRPHPFVRHNTMPSPNGLIPPAFQKPRPTELLVRTSVSDRDSESPHSRDEFSSSSPLLIEEHQGPPVPVRKYRNIYPSSYMTAVSQSGDEHSSSQKKSDAETGFRIAITASSPQQPTDLRPPNEKFLRAGSTPFTDSPSPPSDSGIAVSPPVQTKEYDENSDDAISVTSSALSVESDSCGSKYDNVQRMLQRNDEDGDDEGGTSDGSSSLSDHLVLDSSVESDASSPTVNNQVRNQRRPDIVNDVVEKSSESNNKFLSGVMSQHQRASNRTSSYENVPSNGTSSENESKVTCDEEFFRSGVVGGGGEGGKPGMTSLRRILTTGQGNKVQ